MDQSSALSLMNYRFKYGSKNLSFRQVNVADNKVYLFTNLKDNDHDNLFFDVQTILKTEKKENINRKISKLLITEIKGVKDVNGNLLNDLFYNSYYKFWEFYVQELKPKISAPKDTFFMKRIGLYLRSSRF